MVDKSSPRRRPPRLRAVPPAIRSSGEPFEGFHVLCDTPHEAGVILWQILRDVTLWAQTPEGCRSDLFSPCTAERQRNRLVEAELGEGVRPYLFLVSSLLTRQRSPKPAEVAGACRKVSEWAEGQSLQKTAIAFAQAAAIVWPGSAECAYKVGLLARRQGEYARAESWFRRSIAITRRLPDMQSRALSWIGLGKVYLLRGRTGSAEVAFRRALRAATRSGLTGPKAMALHDLFALAVETHRVSEAQALAQQAARAFGATHPRLPILAHDIAAFWFSLGFFERAQVVFSAVLPFIRRSSERLQVLSSIARAAGGAGKAAVFTDAWVEAWRLIDTDQRMECVATSALKLAYGSASLADWERAELAASYARNLSEARREREVFEQAEGVLDAVAKRQFREVFATSSAVAEVEKGADVLADGLVRKLGEYAGVARNRLRIPCRKLGLPVRADREDPAWSGR